MPGRTSTDLVLLGGGHAHVEVLRRWITRPAARTRLTLVLDRPRTVYSGMVPGFVAGDYGVHELEIDAARLGRRAGAHLVRAAAVGVDARARRIHFADRAPLPYDVASLDVGATVRDADAPGVRAHALVTRPIRAWVDRLDDAIAAAAETRGGALRVAIVGGGAAGVELAFTLDARLRARRLVPTTTLFAAASALLPGDAAAAARRLLAEARRRDVTVRTGVRVDAVEPGRVVVGAERVPADLVVWATGAAPWAWLAASPLAHDHAGFVRVAATLEVVGHDGLFAAGDCATVDGAPWMRKAGVYAVREGPVLARSIEARIAGRPLRPYAPQRRILSIIHLGGRRALATKWGLVVTGHAVWRWKRAIDRRFVARYRDGC